MKPRYYCLLLLPLLTACGGDVKETLGLNKKAPDEFRVVSRPPLSVPPDFDDLPKPGLGSEDHISQQRSDKQAQEIITGRSNSQAPATASTAIKPVKVSKPAAPTSMAETQFLKRVGAGNAQPGIRQELYNERSAQQEDAGIVDKLTTLPPAKDPTVNAQKEADRIAQNKATGKAATEGETPQVKGSNSGILGRLFGY